MPARKKTEPTTDKLDISFEDALAKLESIVESMESEELPLENLVTHYETGSSLLRHCDSILSVARNRIELVTLANTIESDASGHSMKFSNSQPASDPGHEVPDDDNDISLF